MLDKTIPYYNMILKRYKGTWVPDCELGEGYRYNTYTPGDESLWADIMVMVGEFDHQEDALAYFNNEYRQHQDDLKDRMLFLETADGQKIGTLTIWWRHTGERSDPTFEWVALNPNYQGNGLGRCLITEGMHRMLQLEGDQDFYLHTQTWSYKALNIYMGVGYVLSEDETFYDYTNDYHAAMAVIKDLIRDQNLKAFGPFYHGTKADLKPGDLLEPHYVSNYGTRKKANFVYLTATLDAAVWGAELAVGDQPGRIYRVVPLGPIEDDPNLTDKKFPGNPTRSYRTRHPLRVVGEVLDWEGHPPEVLQTMLNHLEELKRQGIEAINE